MIMSENVRMQILAIRATGLTNMFDINTVQRIAFDAGYYELASFLENNKRLYIHFIMTGEAV